MIISHKYKFIFIAIPKTGTHGMRRLLRPYLGAEDWEQENLFEKKRLPISKLARLNHGHITAQQIRPHLDQDIWETYFKFAIVRNPFDRFVSTCAFLLRNTPKADKIMPTFMSNALKRPAFRAKVLTQSQSSFLTDNTGDIGTIDSIWKLEEMPEAIQMLRDKIQINLPPMDVANKSNHKDYSHYATSSLTVELLDYYKVDFKNFDYAQY